MNKFFSTTVEDSNDGSGDLLLNLPPDFLKQHDWREGDEISIKVVDGSIQLRNTSKDTRERELVR